MTDNFRDEWRSLQARVEDLSMAHGLDIAFMRAQSDRIRDLERRINDLYDRLTGLEETVGNLVVFPEQEIMPIENGNSSFEDAPVHLPEQRAEIDLPDWYGDSMRDRGVW